jgi:hypothetical protein
MESGGDAAIGDLPEVGQLPLIPEPMDHLPFPAVDADDDQRGVASGGGGLMPASREEASQHGNQEEQVGANPHR